MKSDRHRRIVNEWSIDILMFIDNMNLNSLIIFLMYD